MPFGNMVSSAREETRLNLHELALRLGVSPSTLSRIEATEHIPGNQLITRLIQILQLNEELAWKQVGRQRSRGRGAIAKAQEDRSSLTPVPIVGTILPER